MALIKKSEFKKMEKKQLLEKKVEIQKEMIKVNAQLSTKTTPENPGRIREMKKTIARINTMLTQISNQVKVAPQEHIVKNQGGKK